MVNGQPQGIYNIFIVKIHCSIFIRLRSVFRSFGGSFSFVCCNCFSFLFPLLLLLLFSCSSFFILLLFTIKMKLLLCKLNLKRCDCDLISFSHHSLHSSRFLSLSPSIEQRKEKQNTHTHSVMQRDMATATTALEEKSQRDLRLHACL